MNQKGMHSVYLLGTEGCHLCELAVDLFSDPDVESLFRVANLNFQKVDISTDEKLVERYGIRIPVVRTDACDKELGWPFDQQQLVDYLFSVSRLEV